MDKKRRKELQSGARRKEDLKKTTQRKGEEKLYDSGSLVKKGERAARLWGVQGQKGGNF